jgi:hypothetical protein
VQASEIAYKVSMINQCLEFMAASGTGEKCVGVLVTDGSPTECDQTQANLFKIVKDGLAQGVTTFALGLPGSDLNFLNALAAAGGTGSAIDVSAGALAFVAALNSVRTRGGSECPSSCEKKCGGTCVPISPVNGCAATSCSACTVPTNGFATCNGAHCDFGCIAGFQRSGPGCIPEVPPDGGGVVTSCNGTPCTNSCPLNLRCCLPSGACGCGAASSGCQ